MSADLDKLAACFGEADDFVDLSDTITEAWLALLFFWALGFLLGVVAMQVLVYLAPR
jgi:hypothetical protein